MTTGSPLWQTIFISFALVLILFEVVRGWRLGVETDAGPVQGVSKDGLEIYKGVPFAAPATVQGNESGLTADRFE